jgi:hypothetical protein
MGHSCSSLVRSGDPFRTCPTASGHSLDLMGAVSSCMTVLPGRSSVDHSGANRLRAPAQIHYPCTSNAASRPSYPPITRTRAVVRAPRALQAQLEPFKTVETPQYRRQRWLPVDLSQLDQPKELITGLTCRACQGDAQCMTRPSRRRGALDQHAERVAEQTGERRIRLGAKHSGGLDGLESRGSQLAGVQE